MCDTLVKFNKSSMIFGKNSDRSPNEPNLTIFVPANHNQTEKRRCTYIEIEEHPDTYGILMIRPSWIFGAEMGINEKNVMIGNEAVFTHSKDNKIPRLTGMDLLRLALEEADSAKKACDVIVYYLKKYGQGGNCGFDKHFYYDNSFLVADPKEAYILETTGKEYVIGKVIGQGNISNRLSLEGDYIFHSELHPGNFRKNHTNPLFTYFSKAKIRQKCANDQLCNAEEFSLESMISLLQSHLPKDQQSLYKKGSVGSLCMHKSLIGDHTTASMIVEYQNDIPCIWITGSSSPCLSLYLPVFFGQTTPPVYTDLQKSLDHWLRREYLHRAIYSGLIDSEMFRAKLHLIQSSWIQKCCDLLAKKPTLSELEAFSHDCFLEEEKIIGEYQNIIDQVIVNPKVLANSWAKKTENLGKNVFEVDFEKRNFR